MEKWLQGHNTSPNTNAELSNTKKWLQGHNTSPNTNAELSNTNLIPNIALRKVIEEWEEAYALHVRRGNIILEATPIAAGSFKEVFKGNLRLDVQGEEAKHVVVAVLRMRRGDCATEASMLLKLGRHPRLVRFMGQCLDGDEHLLLTEFAELGSLSDAFETLEGKITLAHQLIMMQQIALAMEFLVTERVLHRDLAARNVLLFVFDEQDVIRTSVKVTDFGLARSLDNRTHLTVAQGGLPMRHMSPEALRKSRFSEKSDVWGFGVTCWEILTMGDKPFFSLPDDEKVVAHVCAGGKLQRADICGGGEGCPDELWNLIASCWALSPKDRPSFSELVVAIGRIREQPEGAALMQAGGGSTRELRDSEWMAISEDVEAVVSAMNAQINFGKAQAFGCCCIYRLVARDDGTLNQDNQVKIVRAGGIEAVVNGMQQHPASVELQATGCAALGKLVLNDDDVTDDRIMLASVRNIMFKMVVKAMKQHAGSLGVQENGCSALSRLADSETQIKIAGIGSVKAVVDAMKTHSFPLLQKHGCSALANLALNNENRVQIASAGGIKVVVEAMKKFPTYADLQGRGCGALGILALREDGKGGKDENRMKIVQAGGIEVLLGAMRNHSASGKVHEDVCGLLSQLSLNDECSFKIASAGGIEALVDVLKQHSDSAGVQEQGCCALRVLAFNDENRVRIVRAGGTEAVVDAMKNVKLSSSVPVQAHGCGGLAHLAENDENKVRIVRVGGIEAVVDAMRKLPASFEVQQGGCGALAYLAENDENKVKIARAGGIKAVVDAMRKLPASVEVQQEGCGALANLAVNDENQVKIASSGGIEALVDALKQHPDSKRVQERGCLALVMLAHNADNMVKISSAGGLKAMAGVEAMGGMQAIVDAVKKHPGYHDGDVQQGGSNALSMLAAPGAPAAEKRGDVEAAKAEANALYSNSKYEEAIAKYTAAIALIPELDPADDGVMASLSGTPEGKLRAVLLSNRAQAWLKVGEAASAPDGIESKKAKGCAMKAFKDANLAVKLAPQYSKAQYRKGVALLGFAGGGTEVCAQGRQALEAALQCPDMTPALTDEVQKLLKSSKAGGGSKPHNSERAGGIEAAVDGIKQSSAGVQWMAKQQDVEAVLSAMKAQIDSSEAQASGCDALCRLLRRGAGLNEENLSKMARAGGIETVLGGMKQHLGSSVVQEIGCSVLSYFATNDMNLVEITRRGGIEVVVNAMKQHPGSTRMQSEGCGTLAMLALNDDCNVRIAGVGGIEAMLDGMKQHLTSANVQLEGCQGLGVLAMSYSDDNADKIVSLGGIKAVVDAMKQHPAASQLQERGCAALVNLAWNDEKRAKIAKAGGILAVMDALKQHPTSAGVQEWGRKALDNFGEA